MFDSESFSHDLHVCSFELQEIDENEGCEGHSISANLAIHAQAIGRRANDDECEGFFSCMATSLTSVLA